MTAVLRVALTGGIGSGKTTIANKFEELNVPVIDSDCIARQVVEPGKASLKEIVKNFGEELLNDKGELNRKHLRQIIFNNDEAKQKLEAILHPIIYDEIENQISRLDHPYCLIVIPLLFETKATHRFDRILVIDVPESLQITRATKRDKTSEKDIAKIIQSQVNRDERLKHADDIIVNNASIEELNSSIKKLHEKYLDLSSYIPKKNK